MTDDLAPNQPRMSRGEIVALLAAVQALLIASGLYIRFRYPEDRPPWRFRLLNHGAPLVATLAAMAWTGRRPSEYGFTLSNWRASLSAAPLRLLPGVAMLAASWASKPPKRLPEIDRMARRLAEMPIAEMLPYHALVALGEEALFRGFLQRELEDHDPQSLSVGPARVEGAVAVAATIFGLFHLANLTLRPVVPTLGQVAFATLFGMHIGTLARRHGTLAGPVVIHMMTNVFSMLALKRQLQLAERVGAAPRGLMPVEPEPL